MPNAENITRTIMGGVPAVVAVLFYICVFAACGFAGLVFLTRILRYRRANADKRDAAERRGVVAGVISVVSYLTFHKQLLRDRYAGVAHMLMFYGLFILFIGTCLVFLEHDTPLHFFYGRFYLIASLIIDLGGVVMIVGLVLFLARRMRPGQRILREWWVVSLVWLLLVIAVTGFVLEGARIAQDMPGFERWSVVGYTVALGLRAVGIEGDTASDWHRVTWIIHAIFCIAFFALLPWKFFSHMVHGAVSWATRTTRPRAELVTPALERTDPGATTWEQLGWHDLLQADACTTCGRCNAVCPAEAAGKPLHPRDVVLSLREAMHEPISNAGVPRVSNDVLWSCTTCGACNEACPVGIEVYNKIVDLRRGRVEAGHVPPAAEAVFANTAERFNPYGKQAGDRMAWTHGLDVPVAAEDESIELLYWIGCAGSFDPDGRSVSRDMIRILNHLDINYRVLGPYEKCTGDPARRMGEEGLYQSLARENIAQLKAHGVTRVLTHCPHCFNTFRNEYPKLGGRFEVEHHSQFLARMIADQRLNRPESVAGDLTFHDPCYLGRGNGETQAPRDVLMSLPQVNLIEMPRHGRESFCCGAGGGAMWLDVPGETRVENLRVKEAAATGAKTVVTGCPFCKSMMEAGRQSLDGDGAAMNVRDLAELVVEAEGLA